MLLRCKSLEPSLSQLGHFRSIQPFLPAGWCLLGSKSDLLDVNPLCVLGSRAFQGLDLLEFLPDQALGG